MRTVIAVLLAVTVVTLGACGVSSRPVFTWTVSSTRYVGDLPTDCRIGLDEEITVQAGDKVDLTLATSHPEVVETSMVTTTLYTLRGLRPGQTSLLVSRNGEVAYQGKITVHSDGVDPMFADLRDGYGKVQLYQSGITCGGWNHLKISGTRLLWTGGQLSVRYSLRSAGCAVVGSDGLVTMPLMPYIRAEGIIQANLEARPGEILIGEVQLADQSQSGLLHIKTNKAGQEELVVEVPPRP